VMRALAASAVPVPHVYGLCEDESLVGAGFYVMDFVDGTVFRGGAMPGLEPAQRAVAYEHANNVIADLHCVDPATVGLAHFGKAESYFERMLARWTRQYRASQ